MSPPNLIGLMIAALGTILVTAVAVGLPALAVVAIKFFKFKERELALEMEYRHKSQHKDLALEERVQRLENALTSLDHDVRVRLGIEKTATPLASHPELLEGPGAPDAARENSLDSSWSKTQ
jgi:hypothetical protein